MSLKQKSYLYAVGLVISFAAMCFLKPLWQRALGVVALILMMIFYFRSVSCPECGEYLGRGSKECCTRCGAKINWDKKAEKE